MSSEPTATRDRTEALEWYVIGWVTVLLALFVGGVAWSVDGGAGAVVGWLVAAGLMLLVGEVCLMVGATITGTTIALRAEHARRERERSAPRAD